MATTAPPLLQQCHSKNAPAVCLSENNASTIFIISSRRSYNFIDAVI